MTGPADAPTSVCVLAGPGLAVDAELLAELVAGACAGLGLPGRVGYPADLAAAIAVELADPGTAVVALPGPTDRFGEPPGAHRLVWYEPGHTGPIVVPGGAEHQWGRGVWGVVWAVRHAVRRLADPGRLVAYGPAPDQWVRWRGPATATAGLLLVHGGYWRSMWGADLLDAAAIALAGRGYLVANLEYRRPDRHGWVATVADVATGLDRLCTVDGLAGHRIGVLGHSAGGQLALRAAADRGGLAVAVSLAGVLDLAEGYRRRLSNGAVPAALGGPPERVPDRYATADPLARLPLGVAQVLVHGTGDDPDLVDIGRRYAAAARAAGDPVELRELPGDHFDVIDPGHPLWTAVEDALLRHLPP